VAGRLVISETGKSMILLADVVDYSHLRARTIGSSGRRSPMISPRRAAGVDVDNVDAGLDSADKILILRSRPTVQSKEALYSGLDLGDPPKVEMFAA
jgi:hypothetical protein